MKPRIIAITCNWCSYAGADLAGTSRIIYPSNVRIVRVMCTGRIDPTFILTAFNEGADGVLIGGCHPGDCHYISGNLKAQQRVILLKKILAEMEIDPKRLRLVWISAAEGEKFARIVREFTKELHDHQPVDQRN